MSDWRPVHVPNFAVSLCGSECSGERVRTPRSTQICALSTATAVCPSVCLSISPTVVCIAYRANARVSQWPVQSMQAAVNHDSAIIIRVARDNKHLLFFAVRLVRPFVQSVAIRLSACDVAATATSDGQTKIISVVQLMFTGDKKISILGVSGVLLDRL